MAINGIVHGSNEVQWGIAEESTFGTAIADNGTFFKLDGPVPDPDYGVFHDNNMHNNKLYLMSAYIKIFNIVYMKS